MNRATKPSIRLLALCLACIPLTMGAQCPPDSPVGVTLEVEPESICPGDSYTISWQIDLPTGIEFCGPCTDEGDGCAVTSDCSPGAVCVDHQCACKSYCEPGWEATLSYGSGLEHERALEYYELTNSEMHTAPADGDVFVGITGSAYSEFADFATNFGPILGRVYVGYDRRTLNFERLCHKETDGTVNYYYGSFGGGGVSGTDVLQVTNDSDYRFELTKRVGTGPWIAKVLEPGETTEFFNGPYPGVWRIFNEECATGDCPSEPDCPAIPGAHAETGRWLRLPVHISLADCPPE
ncbi:MAG: hypothetical protein J5J06_06155 [Phycisphaerae bacterium]|nr:hypothetical protein [Phycisphaerae bacterium]